MEEILKAIQGLHDRFDKVEKQISHLDKQVSHLEIQTTQGFREMNEKLDRNDWNSNEDVISLLKTINKNTETLSKDTSYLSKKVGNHDMILNRLNEN
ncbi:hypothetical protein [Bacillus sp. FJAT-44742]|uniref:hypothetical protein n=1 Tax=Bacillus sp. FJAT-44742 TaxID=2014005 RepID=UPI000C247AC6|nr:hypothetical protein [Bacillus sp. FJAT-44742]